MLALPSCWTKILTLVLISIFLVPSGVYYAGNSSSPPRYEPVTRKYTLTVTETKVQIDPWNYWNAWTFNGTVPGPTLRANMGDTLEVTLFNKQAGVHSLHSHQSGYQQAYDGTILGAYWSMVATGRNFTYVIKAERAGLFYYHCHSDYVHPIAIHIHQGLYGALIVDDSSNPLPPAKENILVMSETLVPDNLVILTGEPLTKYVSMLESGNSTRHIINGAGYPLTPTLTGRTGDRVRIYLINFGEFQHSFHVHNHALYVYKQVDYGRGLRRIIEAVEGDVLSLDPGQVAIVDLIAGMPGAWMYHSHTVSQAEMGMMGLFLVTP